MKSLTKRNLLLVVLSLIVALCSLTFAATVKPARAEEFAKPETLQFEVMEAASIRIGKSAEVETQSTSGLRFRVQMDYATASYVKGNEGVKLGFIITPKALFDNRAAAEDSSYGIDDYINSISNYVGNDGEGIIVDESTIYIADASDNITKWETTDDIATEGETYYANGAVQGILKDNINLGFTVIAYILDGEEYTYSVPSADFERSYTQTATKAYLSGKNDLEVIQKAQHLSNFGKEETNPLAITDGQELYKISEDVSNEKTYNGFYFELRENVEVNRDKAFTLIPASFAGTFVKSDKSVKIINGGVDKLSIFANAEEDGANVKCTHTLFTVTSSSAEKMYIQSEDKGTADGYMSNAEVAAAVDGLANPVGYTGDALKYTITVENGGGQVFFGVKPYFTAKELQETPQLQKYNAVKFTYMTPTALRPYSNPNTDDYSLVGLSGYGTNQNNDICGWTVSSNKTEEKTWRTHIVSIDEFLRAYDGDTKLTVYSRPSAGTTGEYYLGDIELVEDPYIFYRNVEIRNAIGVVTPVITEKASNTVVSENTTATKIFTYTSSSKTHTFVKHEALPTTSKAKTEIIGSCPAEFNDRRILRVVTQTTPNAYYVKMNYTAEQLEAFAGVEEVDGVKSYNKYTHISLTYMINAQSSAGLTANYKGILPLDKLNEWCTIKIDIPTFIKYMGMDTFSDDTYTYDVTGYQMYLTGEKGQSSRLMTTIGADYYDSTVFLGYFTANVAADLYIADISFVTPAAQ